MYESMATLILAIVGGLLFLCIVLYGVYITFYPIVKTLGGLREAMKDHEARKEAEEEEKTEQEKENRLPPAAH